MFAFRCERFPRGVAHIRTAGGAVVDFVDGRAEVDDPELAQALREVPAVFRIVEAETQNPPTPDPVPPPRRGKGSGLEVWTEYAVACGHEVPDGVTRDQVIEALAAAGVPVE